MGPDTDTAFELADLNRKLATARALLSYEHKCAETRLLTAAEEQRQLRVKLIHLEPEYSALLEDYQNHERYTDEVEAVLASTTERLNWSEGAVARYKERTKELEEKLQMRLTAEGSERGAMGAELERLRGECRVLEERVRELAEELEVKGEEAERVKGEVEKLRGENRELEALKGENIELEGELIGLRAEGTAGEEEKKTLKTEIATLKTRLQDHVDRLAKALATKQALEAEHNADKAALEKEMAVLRAELDDSQASDTALKAAKKQVAVLQREVAAAKQELAATKAQLESVDTAAPPPPPAPPASAAEVVALKAALKKETAAREKAEKELALKTTDWGHQKETLESFLRRSEAKVARLTAATAATAADAAADAAAPTARGKKAKAAAAPAESRKRPMTMEDLANSPKRPRNATSEAAEASKATEFALSSLTPFFRHKAVVTTDSPVSPTAAGAADSTTMADETLGNTTIGNRSLRPEHTISIPSAIATTQPVRLLLAGTSRHRKPGPTIPAPKPVLTIEDSPEPAPRVKPKAAVKKSRVKKIQEEEAPAKLPIAIESTPEESPEPIILKRKKLGGGGGVGPVLAGAGMLGETPPMAKPRGKLFEGEISPAKKRPDALKGWFPGAVKKK